MSSTIGAHHSCFIHIDGLASQAAAPSNPPIMETAADGFLCRIQEQTINFLMTMAAMASAISRPNSVQLPFAPMPEERMFSGFLQLYPAVYSHNGVINRLQSVGQPICDTAGRNVVAIIGGFPSDFLIYEIAVAVFRFGIAPFLKLWTKIQTISRSMGHTMTSVVIEPDLEPAVPGIGA